MAQPRTARLGLGFIWGVLGFSLVALIAMLSRGGKARVDEYEAQRAENRLKTRLELEEAAQKKLSEYAWVNKEKGVVAVPIERAMELSIAELQARKVSDSGEKAVLMPTLIVPPYLTEKSEAQAPEGEAAPVTPAAPAGEAVEGAAAPVPATAPEGGEAPAATDAAPESVAPVAPSAPTEAAPAETPAATPEPQPAAPAATEAATPAAPETPSEP